MNFKLLKQANAVVLLKWCVGVVIFLFSAVTFAGTEFVEGRDYSVVKASVTQRNVKTRAKNEVVEFFSYGCPGCFALEADLAPWAAAHKKKIQFKRVPVAFSPTWLPLVKAYYIAKAYGKEKPISKALFVAIHDKHQDLTKPEEISKIFKIEGISQKDFSKAYTYSSVINAQVKQGEQLRQQFNVAEIPTVVIGGKYITDLGRVGGDPKKMLVLMQYLMHKTS